MRSFRSSSRAKGGFLQRVEQSGLRFLWPDAGEGEEGGKRRVVVDVRRGVTRQLVDGARRLVVCPASESRS